MEKFHLLVLVFGFEAVLRMISHWTKDESGKPKYPLLSPIYFILITPIFYLGAWVLEMSGNSLSEEYFFPPLTDGDGDGMGSDTSMWDIFHVVDFRTISWTAVLRSIPTMIALVMFSLIHVPINIPAFAVSTNVDVDMNTEMIGLYAFKLPTSSFLLIQCNHSPLLFHPTSPAHGYSNGIVGLFGGKSVVHSGSVVHFYDSTK